MLRTAVSVISAALILSACSGEDVETTATGDGTEGAASWAGRTLDLVVPYDPGGGYDTYARLLAPHLEECLNATVVVKNKPGAGGLLATAQTFVAPPDVPRMILTNTVGVISAQLADAAGANYKASEFSWLGRISAEPNVLTVASDSKFRSFQDLIEAERPVRFAATGPGSNDYVNSTVVPEVYGFPAEVISGFEGSDEARASVLSGDADAQILPLDSQVDAIEAGDVKPLLVIDDQPHEALPDVPTTADFAPEDGQSANLEALVDLARTGRSLAGPPGMEPVRLASLRQAAKCAVHKKGLLEAAGQQQRDIDPLTGEQTQKVVDEALDAPPRFRTLIKGDS